VRWEHQAVLQCHSVHKQFHPSINICPQPREASQIYNIKVPEIALNVYSEVLGSARAFLCHLNLCSEMVESILLSRHQTAIRLIETPGDFRDTDGAQDVRVERLSERHSTGIMFSGKSLTACKLCLVRGEFQRWR
jgi:hypothetical protein